MPQVGQLSSKPQQTVGGWPGKHVAYWYIFKQRLRTRGYPKTIVERSLSGVHFASRPSALTQKKKANERILPFGITNALENGVPSDDSFAQTLDMFIRFSCTAALSVLFFSRQSPLELQIYRQTANRVHFV